MKKVAVVSAYQKTFIEQDIKALKDEFEVLKLQLPKKNLRNILQLLRIIQQTDLVLIWFADFWAMLAVFLSKILGKKTVVVVGGYELAALPDLNYGGLLRKRAYRMVSYILKNADRVLFVDDSLRQEARSKLHLNLESFQVVPSGIDTNFFVEAGAKKNMVLTVAACHTTEIAILKGLDKFADVAKLLPEITFCIVGAEAEAAQWLRALKVKNLKIVNQLPPLELLKYYQQASVYCQLSVREGLPNALCEAMLCGCVPVGSNVNGIPTAIGNTGVICPDRELITIYNSIKTAMEMGKTSKPRLRIKENFSLQLRKKKLKEIFEELL